MMSQLIDPTYLDRPLSTINTLYNHLEPLWSNMNPHNSAKSTRIFMKLKTWANDAATDWSHLMYHPLFTISALYNPLEQYKYL